MTVTRVGKLPGWLSLTPGVQIVAMVTTLPVPELQRREDGLLEDCLAHLEDSLQDPCYAARRHAALTVPSLYVRLAGRYQHSSGSPAEAVRAASRCAHELLCGTSHKPPQDAGHTTQSCISGGQGRLSTRV